MQEPNPNTKGNTNANANTKGNTMQMQTGDLLETQASFVRSPVEKRENAGIFPNSKK